MWFPSMLKSLSSRLPRSGRGNGQRKGLARRRPIPRCNLFVERLEDRLVPSAIWVDQGPGTVLNVDSGEGIPNQPADGAVQALAVAPSNANIVYAASVGGGIWKTTDGTDASPVWTPLTDQSLPAEAMQSIAISPVSPNTIFAGTGTTSSFDPATPLTVWDSVSRQPAADLPGMAGARSAATLARHITDSLYAVLDSDDLWDWRN